MKIGRSPLGIGEKLALKQADRPESESPHIVIELIVIAIIQI
jgi:hypothetical protein